MEKTARERKERKREEERKIAGWFSRIWKSRTHDSRRLDFELDFPLCSRCYTPFRHPCETISLSKFNANTVQIRQPHCWGPIKGHKAAQLLLIREGRQTGLKSLSFFRSISHFRSSFQPRERETGKEGEEYRSEHYVGPFTRDILRWCPVATFTLLKICFPHSLCMRLSFVTWRYARRIFNDSRFDRHLSPVCPVVLFFSPPSKGIDLDPSLRRIWQIA